MSIDKIIYIYFSHMIYLMNYVTWLDKYVNGFMNYHIMNW